MLRPRVIPTLLLSGRGLYKTVQFARRAYVGDPVNTVRIFNEKEADELVILDIDATPAGREPNYTLLEEIAGEAFMPLAYGGGIREVHQVRKVLSLGVEKVVINTSAHERPELVTRVAEYAGSSACTVAIDVKKRTFGGQEVFVRGGTQRTRTDPVEYARRVEALGAGEILLNCIDRDGTMSGYDLDLVARVAGAVDIPVVASGGAASVEDFARAIAAGASAAAAGAMFVYQGRHRAVLISYPSPAEIDALAASAAASAMPAGSPNRR